MKVVHPRSGDHDLVTSDNPLVADGLAYLLLVHTAPTQAAELIRELASPRAAFYVHIDRSAPAAVADELVRATSGVRDVRLVDRHYTPWAGFGLVRATLACLRAAAASQTPFTHAVLLSGQDFPIRPRADIEAFFAAHRGTSFMEWHDMPFWSDTHQRLRHWHFRSRHLHLRVPARRRAPEVVAPVRGGSMWWSLAWADVRHCLDTARRHPEVVRYFRHTDIPDETFFQSVVLSRAEADVVNDPLRYVRWNDPEGAHPATLTHADLDALTGADALFARKFDEAEDPGVLATVRSRLLSPSVTAQDRSG